MNNKLIYQNKYKYRIYKIYKIHITHMIHKILYYMKKQYMIINYIIKQMIE